MIATPQLALMARLGEAVTWDDAIRRHETDAWAYMRRKLEATEEPLRAYTQEVFAQAKKRLLDDLALPMLPPGAMEAHKETFEALLPPGDFADLSFQLHPAADRAARLEGVRSILSAAKAPTLFDHEKLPPEKRGRAWEKRVAAISERLGLKTLNASADRGPTPAKRAYLARRLRRNLREYLAVTRGEGAVRDEVTPFMLARIEAAVAASLRLLNRWR
jgi:hypothetical protein